MKLLVRLVVLALVALMTVPASRARSQSAPLDARATITAIQVHLNGRRLASGVAIRTHPGARRLLMALGDLQAAVDGAASDPRLAVRSRALYAVRRGGCDGCILRVNRTVLITAALERVGGRVYVPVVDVVRAFEGRLERIDGSTYAIHVGLCSWCILEPDHD